jgi:hypothetical protein
MVALSFYKILRDNKIKDEEIQNYTFAGLVPA